MFVTDVLIEITTWQNEHIYINLDIVKSDMMLNMDQSESRMCFVTCTSVLCSKTRDISCYNSAAKWVHANHMRVNCPLIGQCESAYVSGFCS